MKRVQIGRSAFMQMVAIVLACLSFAGCTVSDVHDFQGPIPAGKGILLVSVDTDTKITKLFLTEIHSGTDDVAIEDLPLGKSVHAILLPVGDYAWTRVALPDILMADRDYSPDSEALQA